MTVDVDAVLAAALGAPARQDPTTVPVTYDVPPGRWHAALAGLHAAGFSYLDFLTAVDRPTDDVVEVVAHLANPDAAWAHVLVRTRCQAAAPVLDSVADVHPGAVWHERETAEMFGVAFTGGDPRPLLRTPAPVDGGAVDPPLRKAFPLTARGVVPWPGAADPADAGNRARRRVGPPGVPDWPTASSDPPEGTP